MEAHRLSGFKGQRSKHQEIKEDAKMAMSESIKHAMLFITVCDACYLPSLVVNKGKQSQTGAMLILTKEEML